MDTSERNAKVLAAWQEGCRQGARMGRERLAEVTGLTVDQCRGALVQLRNEGKLVREGGVAAPADAGEVAKNPEFEVEPLPSEALDLEALKSRRREQWGRRQRAFDARKLISVKVNLPGPIGIMHMGDPHVDDVGTDFPALERDIEIVNRTEGLFGANIGDQQNNWMGRLAHLWGKEEQSAREAWMLTEWLVQAVPWLYILNGNHDVWSGQGDPLKWLCAPKYGKEQGIHADHGARLALHFPNGKEVRIHARHDFPGHSQWNPVHGPSKAAQRGFADHLLICGHKHVSGDTFVVNPLNGLISWVVRVAGYKTIDDYAAREFFAPHRISASCVTIIDPQYADDDPRLLHRFYNTEQAAEFLTWLRRREG